MDFQVTFDAVSPKVAAEFWKVALGYRSDDPPPGFDNWDDALRASDLPEDRWDDANAIVDPAGVGPRLWFQKVPEDKIAKNRVHLDVSVGKGIKDPASRWQAVQRHVDLLVAAGGLEVDERRDDFGGHWMVMADPEGNEFCVQ